MIKDRIIQLIEYKDIKKEIFYKKIGVTSANFRGKAKQSDVVSETIAKILSEIPDVNPEWLLTGKGEMIKNKGKDGQHESISILDDRFDQLNNSIDTKVDALQSSLNGLEAMSAGLLEVLDKIREDLAKLYQKDESIIASFQYFQQSLDKISSDIVEIPKQIDTK